MASSVHLAKQRVAPALAQPPKRGPHDEISRLAAPDLLSEIVGAAGFHDMSVECAFLAP